MGTDYDYVIVFVTASGIEEARKISQIILEKKKAACANIISGVSSSFWWHGKIENADEVLLIIKTKASKLDEIISLVKQNHSYEVPEMYCRADSWGQFRLFEMDR